MATINFTNYVDGVDAYYFGAGNAAHTYNLLKGDDVFYGYAARDTVWGGDGADNIHGGSGGEILHGNAGNDYIVGDWYGRTGSGSDTIWAGSGNDYISSWGDAIYDVVSGGTGNDRITADGDKIDAGDGHDDVIVELYAGNEHADIKLGTGYDDLEINLHNPIQSRIDVRDFTVNDTLTFTARTGWESLDTGQVLDRLDRNNDGWLGAKDVDAWDTDGINVHVGKTFLELDILDTSVFLHGMTKASFDFLS